MGFYDTYQAQVQPRVGQPYDVKDILMSSQAITGGLDKLLANAASDRKAQQQFEANQYVDKLLGNTTSDNYEAQSAQARGFLPYASPEMAQQWQQFGADIKGQRDYAHQQQDEALKASDLANNLVKTENEKAYQSGMLTNEQNRLLAQQQEWLAQHELKRQEIAVEKRKADAAFISANKRETPTNYQNELLGNTITFMTKQGKTPQEILEYIMGVTKPPKEQGLIPFNSSKQSIYDPNIGRVVYNADTSSTKPSWQQYK